MHRHLLLLAFIRARLESGSCDPARMAQQLSEDLLDAYGEACDVQALLEWHARATNEQGVHLRATLSEALSRYVGYTDYEAFVREFDDDMAKLPEALRREKELFESVGVLVLMLFTVLLVWGMDKLRPYQIPREMIQIHNVRPKAPDEKAVKVEAADLKEARKGEE